MAHMTPYEMNEFIKKMREGKEVICPYCNMGVMKTKYDPKLTHNFKCDKCGIIVNID